MLHKIFGFAYKLTVSKSIEIEASTTLNDVQKLVDKLRCKLISDGSISYKNEEVQWSGKEGRLLHTDPPKITVTRYNGNIIVKVMKDFRVSATIYYSAVITITTALLMGLIYLLDWPLLAEIPLAASLFLHILYLTKSFYQNWLNEKKVSVEKITMGLKSILLSKPDIGKDERVFSK